MSELKNCPFCGGKIEPDNYKDHEYVCKHCDLWGIDLKWWNTRPIEQALLESSKRSQQQRDDIFADLVKAQEALKECLTLIDNEGLSPRGNLRKKVAEAIQGEPG